MQSEDGDEREDSAEVEVQIASLDSVGKNESTERIQFKKVKDVKAELRDEKGNVDINKIAEHAKKHGGIGYIANAIHLHDDQQEMVKHYFPNITAHSLPKDSVFENPTKPIQFQYARLVVVPRIADSTVLDFDDYDREVASYLQQCGVEKNMYVESCELACALTLGDMNQTSIDKCVRYIGSLWIADNNDHGVDMDYKKGRKDGEYVGQTELHNSAMNIALAALQTGCARRMVRSLSVLDRLPTLVKNLLEINKNKDKAQWIKIVDRNEELKRMHTGSIGRAPHSSDTAETAQDTTIYEVVQFCKHHVYIGRNGKHENMLFIVDPRKHGMKYSAGSDMKNIGDLVPLFDPQILACISYWVNVAVTPRVLETGYLSYTEKPLTDNEFATQFTARVVSDIRNPIPPYIIDTQANANTPMLFSLRPPSGYRSWCQQANVTERTLFDARVLADKYQQRQMNPEFVLFYRGSRQTPFTNWEVATFNILSDSWHFRNQGVLCSIETWLSTAHNLFHMDKNVIASNIDLVLVLPGKIVLVGPPIYTAIRGLLNVSLHHPDAIGLTAGTYCSKFRDTLEILHDDYPNDISVRQHGVARSTDTSGYVNEYPDYNTPQEYKSVPLLKQQREAEIDLPSPGLCRVYASPSATRNVVDASEYMLDRVGHDILKHVFITVKHHQAAHVEYTNKKAEERQRMQEIVAKKRQSQNNNNNNDQTEKEIVVVPSPTQTATADDGGDEESSE